MGYRYYDTSLVRTQYPFGYGLSYTEFTYSGMEADEHGASFVVANTGSMDGAEVAQLYVALPDSKVFRPSKELKGFKKVFLKKGESRRIQIPFDDKTFRYWNMETGRWETEEGEYLILVGACVADIRLSGRITVKGTTDRYPYSKAEMPSYYSGMIHQVNDQEFGALLGYPVPDGRWTGELGVNDAICQMYYAKSRLARFLYRVLTDRKKRSEEKGKPDLNILFIYNMPFRAIAKMTGGAVSMDMVHGMLAMVNGHFFRGITRLIGGYFSNQKSNRQYERRLQEGRTDERS